MNKIDYDNINWSEHFYYDPTSPSCLRYAKDVQSVTGKGGLRTYKLKDEVAGFVKKKGKKEGNNFQYWVVLHEGRRCFVHRIIARLLGVKVNDKSVDHIDGNGLNNSKDNIRVVSQALNMKNSKKSSANTSGTTGIGYREGKKINHSDYWFCYWYNMFGELKSKTFSCRKYGEEKAKQLAIEYREKMVQELNSQGAGYTERHGK